MHVQPPWKQFEWSFAGARAGTIFRMAQLSRGLPDRRFLSSDSGVGSMLKGLEAQVSQEFQRYTWKLLIYQWR
ncbi:MAG: hypothetical protein DMG13_22675 [Acidobacteria bacterium]|nr:MAG: hypothetical protein DMG13_22675 [Acidobacteriota bacterium]